MKVDIIGAGIGGLTTAIALQGKGVKVRIYEQTDALKPVGAGILLANNAMQVYQKLGLKPQIEKLGNPISLMNITTKDLNVLSRADLSHFETRYHCQNIAIHRAFLQQIMTEHLPPNSLNFGYKLAEIETYENKNLLRFENGKEITSSITLGADGLNSTVRKQLFPNTKIRRAHQICWRGVVPISLPQKFLGELNEAWGHGDRFGFVQIAPGKVYWYALKSFNQKTYAYSIERLSDYFSNYHEIIKNIIRQTPTETIHTATIEDLKSIKSWFKGKVCLMGDAAHATTPNMGQGACQAIEDAYILGECLDKFSTEEAFSTFQKLRTPKVKKVVNTSWHIGKMAHWKNPLARGLRNQIIKRAPKYMGRKQSERIFELETV